MSVMKSVMVTGGFRIVCELSDFFCDKRRKTYFFIDLSKLHIIKDLIIRIQDTFNLNFDVSLAINDSYIPDLEDIRVLHDGDEVKVFRKEFVPATAAILERNCSVVLGTINSIEANNSVAENEDNTTNSPVKQKRRRRSRKGESKATTPECGLNSTSPLAKVSVHVEDPNCLERKSHNRKKMRERSHREEYETQTTSSFEISADLTQPPDVTLVNAVCNESTIEEYDADLTSIKRKLCASSENGMVESEVPEKRKRKRVRQRTRGKRSKDFQTKEKPDNRMKYSTYFDSVMRNQNIVPATSSSSHVRFPIKLEMDFPTYDYNISTPSCIREDCKSPPLKENGCNRMESDPKEARIAISESVSSVTNQLNSYHSQTNIAPELHTSNNVPFGKILALCNSDPIVVKRIKPLPPSTTAIVEPTLPLLQRMPMLSELITFKVLKLDDNYCPHVSGPITAKVIGCDSDTKQLVLNILAGQDQCQQPQGKFSIDFDPENVQQPVDTVEYNWQELIETVLLPASVL